MSDKNMITVLKVEPQKAPYVKEISNDIRGSQSEVEGLIDCVYLADGCIAVVNDEGKINGMELNRRLENDIIAGPFFICNADREGGFSSLTEAQIEKYSGQFAEIEHFTGLEPEAKPFMMFQSF